MSYLITGGTEEERKQKAEEVVKSKHQVSKFDTLFISGETSIGIEQIRTLSHQLSLKPYNSLGMAAIVHPAELLTVEAQNALLKTLEEEENTIIVLTAPGEDFLLPTVVSRCQVIRLPQKSEITLTQEEFDSLVRDFSSIIKSGVGERLKIAVELGKDREGIALWLTRLVVTLRKTILNQYVSNTYVRIENVTFRPEKVIRQASKALASLQTNVNPRLALEVFLLDLPSFS